MKKLTKMQKEIVNGLYVAEYLHYCLEEVPDVTFLYRNEKLSLKDARKLFSKVVNTDEQYRIHNAFVERIADIAKHDKKFLEYQEYWMDRCRRCGTKPLRTIKLSRHHPEYASMQDDGVLNRVWFERCDNCGFQEIYASGIDEDPEDGVR